MKIEKNKEYRIKGKSKYFKNKYGTENPVIRIEDRHDAIWPNGGWGMQQGNPACLLYAMRSGFESKIMDLHDVWYGKIGQMGELVHASELEEVPSK